MKPEVEQGRTRSFSPCPTLLFVLYDPKQRAPASKGDFLGIISLGCMMENLWLMATALGIDFHIVSSLAGGLVGDQIKHIFRNPRKFEYCLQRAPGIPVRTATTTFAGET